MHSQRHPLSFPRLGTTREVVSFHFGTPGVGPKAYVQASLHADEVPGMLVAHHLRAQLAELDARGAIQGEVILVTAANPIGLAQTEHGVTQGRFDRDTGINFNRGYLNLVPALVQALSGRLGADESANVALIRHHARETVAAWPVKNETEALKKCLLGLAIDADVVLDLHCDSEAVMHLYAGTPLAELVAPLSALLGAHAVLLATESGEQPFDEACGRVWWELAAHFNEAAIPSACIAVTVELRGQLDVQHDTARADAAALVRYLQHRGVVQASVATAAIPTSGCSPTPLAGVEPIIAPHGGVLVFNAQPGQNLQVGDLVAEIVDPVSGVSTSLRASVTGVLFARSLQRFVHAGASVAKIAGAVAFRTGNLLGQ